MEWRRLLQGPRKAGRPSTRISRVTEIARICPTHSDRSDVAHQHVEQDYEEESECSALTSRCLSVDFCKWERAATVDDSIQTTDTIQDRDGITECCEETKSDLSEHRLGKIDFWIWKFCRKSVHNVPC